LQVLKCPYKSKPEENKEKVHLHYSNTVDSWAVGVLVYELLVGCPPFYDKSKSTTEARIVSGVPHFPPTMSEGAKNFICAGECQLLTVANGLLHAWLLPGCSARPCI
jgi:serine/threonine protein kinase